jgi:RNA polymerase sigma-70 factor, ECF subfamily
MGAESLPEPELGRRCRRGDGRAWRELVRRFTPLVYRLSVRMLRDGAEAEDVSQEVFMRVHRSFDGYDPTRPLAPWIARTTYHACLRRLESVGRRAGAPGDDPEELEAVPDDRARTPEQSAQASQASALLARGVAELPAQDRALLDLRYQEGLSDAEVSEATGMAVGTVKTRLFRARARLRGWLAPRLAGGRSRTAPS